MVFEVRPQLDLVLGAPGIGSLSRGVFLLHNKDSISVDVEVSFPRGGPIKLKDMVGKKVPVLPKIFCVIHFLVDFTVVLRVNEVRASCIDRSKGVVSLERVVNEVMNLSAVVERLECASTVFGQPINSFIAQEKDKIWVDRRHLDTKHFSDVAGFSMALSNSEIVLRELP